jgi:hypothetical protein
MFISLVSIGVCLVILLVGRTARADIAPPEPPPGSNVGPGQDVTQVQMMSETVVIDIYALAPAQTVELAGDAAAARVTATFSMRNQGSTTEQIPVRFPLGNVKGFGDGRGQFPEIKQIGVTVDGMPATIVRVTTPNPIENGPPIPWAEFNAEFPPAKEVLIQVTYTVSPQGYLPFGTFHYVLETGAGWKGPIGVADLVVRLPYPASDENVLVDPNFWPRSTPGGTFEGNEIRWHYENLEPTAETLQGLMQSSDGTGAFEVSVLLPNYWRDIVNGRAAVAANGKDGQAWGQLARALKLAIVTHRGLWSAAAGQKLYAEAVAAYEQAVTLLPKEAKWHAGYAELLWQAYAYSSPPDPAQIVRAAQELKVALELDPGNDQAKALLQEISTAYPEFIQPAGTGYTFLVLTTTPTAALAETPTEVVSVEEPTLTEVAPTETPLAPEASATPVCCATATSPSSPTLGTTLRPSEAPTPAPSRPGALCGAAALPLLGSSLFLGRRFPRRQRPQA